MKKRNPVKKNMDKFHKPRTHRDKTKYNRRTESEKLMDDLEPIVHVKQIKQEMQAWEDEGGAIHPDMPAYIHPTEHDESDDLEDAKVIENEYRKLNELPEKND